MDTEKIDTLLAALEDCLSDVSVPNAANEAKRILALCLLAPQGQQNLSGYFNTPTAAAMIEIAQNAHARGIA